MFHPFTIDFFGVFSNNSTTFFINVLTWHGQQNAPKALHQCCVPFIDRECQWLYGECRTPPSQGGLLTKGKVLPGSKFYQVYLRFLSLVDMLHVTDEGFST
jgi:hypothetical protein